MLLNISIINCVLFSNPGVCVIQVFKEEEESIKVDLHEGIGRTKLFWVMCLADAKTSKAMVEFREGGKGKGNFT